MGLEYHGHLAVGIELADREGALAYLGRVVGIVAEVDLGVGLQFEVEAALHTTEACHALTQFVVGDTGQLGHRHGSDAIVDVHAQGYAEAYVLNLAFGVHEVEHNLATTDADVLGMVVALVTRVGEQLYSLL